MDNRASQPTSPGADDGAAAPFPIVVRGRHTTISPRFRGYAEEKVPRLARLAGRILAVDVELSREHNPRLAGSCEQVELTLTRRGPVLRAKAAAADPCAALDLALDKMEEQLRRDADRRHSRGTRTHSAPLSRPVDGPDGTEEAALAAVLPGVVPEE
ncbi:MAG: ribosome hibernation-promoting factor, HPF/YfiA family [Mycobacteriales bacterium]